MARGRRRGDGSASGGGAQRGVRLGGRPRRGRRERPDLGALTRLLQDEVHRLHPVADPHLVLEREAAQHLRRARTLQALRQRVPARHGVPFPPPDLALAAAGPCGRKRPTPPTPARELLDSGQLERGAVLGPEPGPPEVVLDGRAPEVVEVDPEAHLSVHDRRLETIEDVAPNQAKVEGLRALLRAGRGRRRDVAGYAIEAGRGATEIGAAYGERGGGERQGAAHEVSRCRSEPRLPPVTHAPCDRHTNRVEGGCAVGPRSGRPSRIRWRALMSEREISRGL